MFRFLVAAAIIGSLLAYAKGHEVLDRTGMLGSCSPMTATAPKDYEWWECRPGKLTGYPDRSKENCTRGVMRGEVRYWLCPAPLVEGRRTSGNS